MSVDPFEAVLENVRKYKRKRQLNLLLKGIIITIGLIVMAYMVFNVLEYFLFLSGLIRAFLFFSFAFVALASFIFFIVKPFFYFVRSDKVLTDEEAAKHIGCHFYHINDKLLNTLQLYSQDDSNELTKAAISQKSQEFLITHFDQAVNLQENKRYFKLVSVPLILFVVILFVVPRLFTEGTHRIIHYATYYEPPAPFQFNVDYIPFYIFKGEDVSIPFTISGSILPKQVYIFYDQRQHQLKKNFLTYTFKNVQKDIVFYLQGDKVKSKWYTIKVVEKPELKDITIALVFPNYLNRKNDTIKNSGNIVVPEGTIANWILETDKTDSVYFNFASNRYVYAKKIENRAIYTKQINISEMYTIHCLNKFGKNKDTIQFSINAIKDAYPEIQLDQLKDSVSYKMIAFRGELNDDYGLTQLKLYYRFRKQNESSNYFSFITIPIQKNKQHQSLLYVWTLPNSKDSEEKMLEYFWKVWDNDAPHGYKSTMSSTYVYEKPSLEQLEKNTELASAQTTEQLQESIQENTSLQQDIEKIRQKLKTTAELDWEDKKQIQSLLKKKEKLEEELENLKKQYDLLNKKADTQSNLDEKIRKRIAELQKLLQETTDHETERLYKELEKLLSNNQLDKMRDVLKKTAQKEHELENELERALNFFKQIQFDQQVNKQIDDLKKNAELQKQLSDKAIQNNTQKDSLLVQQQKLSKQFEEIKNKIDNLEKMSNELGIPMDTSRIAQQEQAISEEQARSVDALKKNAKKTAGDAQKKASQAMQNLAAQLDAMNKENQSEQIEENILNLENLLDNLLKLSFQQEKNMKSLRTTMSNQSAFLDIVKEQSFIQEQTWIVKDSLLQLSKRILPIQSFTLREVDNLTNYLAETMDQLKKKRIDQALSQQQFSMMTMNNLALLLSDILDQLQQEMANAQGVGNKSKAQQPSMSSITEWQKKLNEKIHQLKKNMEKGQPISKDLAKLAAEQELIRNALRDLARERSKNGENKIKENLDSIIKEMEKTEKEIVNKEIKKETIFRQNEIVTRLLEAEKAMKEKDTEQTRQSQAALQHNKQVPKEFLDFFKAKEKQRELLKTVPLYLNLFYKEQVNQYFNRLKN